MTMQLMMTLMLDHTLWGLVQIKQLPLLADTKFEYEETIFIQLSLKAAYNHNQESFIALHPVQQIFTLLMMTVSTVPYLCIDFFLQLL